MQLSPLSTQLIYPQKRNGMTVMFTRPLLQQSNGGRHAGNNTRAKNGPRDTTATGGSGYLAVV